MDYAIIYHVLLLELNRYCLSGNLLALSELAECAKVSEHVAKTPRIMTRVQSDTRILFTEKWDKRST